MVTGGSIGMRWQSQMHSVGPPVMQSQVDKSCDYIAVAALIVFVVAVALVVVVVKRERFETHLSFCGHIRVTSHLPSQKYDFQLWVSLCRAWRR